MDRAKDRLQALFNSITPAQVKLDMGSLQFRQVVVDMTPDAIRLNGLALGNITLEFQKN